MEKSKIEIEEFDREMRELRESRNRKHEPEKKPLSGIKIALYVAGGIFGGWILIMLFSLLMIGGVAKVASDQIHQATEQIPTGETANPITNYQNKVMGAVDQWQQDEQKKIKEGRARADYYATTEIRSIPPQPATTCQQELGNEINEALMRCTHGYRAEFEKKSGKFIRYVN